MTIGSRARGIDRARLFSVIPEYAEAGSIDAAEKMFERDKAAILDLGLPLLSERDPFDESVVLYRIDRAERGGALDVTPAEYTVLLAASRAWDDAAAGGAARRVRAKLLSLGLDADADLLRRTPRGSVESLPVLTPLLEAVTTGARVSFEYRTADGRKAARRVEPWLVGTQDGRWYMLGFDLDRQAERLFRASRIESFPRVAGRATVPRPADPSLASARGPQGAEAESASAVLSAAPFKALALREAVGAALEAEEIRLEGASRAQVRRMVLSDARWLSVREPAAWRAEIAEISREIAQLHAGAAQCEALEAAPVRRTAFIRPSTGGADHLSRLIAEASYVLSRGGAEIGELAEEFGITHEQLISDLQVLFLCGDLGTGWEDLIETEWDSGTVRVRNADALDRPLRLNAPETMALLAGLAALDPAAGAEAGIVASAREKLTRHLDPAAQEQAQGSGREAAPPGLEQAHRAQGRASAPSTAAPLGRTEGVLVRVQEALGEGAALVIRYSPPDRPGTTVRRIHPIALETDGGRTYVRAHCELAGAERRFRLDRIAEVLGDGAALSDAAGPQALEASGSGSDGLVPGPVWLRLSGPGQWIAEAFDAAELRDGSEGTTFARLDSPVRSALADAVMEAAGAAEILAPAVLRDEIVTIAERSLRAHSPA